MPTRCEASLFLRQGLRNGWLGTLRQRWGSKLAWAIEKC
ncbi:hypothetical protein EKH55_5126 [Sinorhizobium alkalisoli]|nr:hypothetical protein EKH55_5126 [Sinorhizobium alkalisoli]